jgi:hypothetical protein
MEPAESEVLRERKSLNDCNRLQQSVIANNVRAKRL